MEYFLTVWDLDFTHWGRVTHIYFSKLTISGSDNGLSPGRHQTIIWTRAGILLTAPTGQYSVESESKIIHFHPRKFTWECRLKWRPFSPISPENSSDYIWQDYQLNRLARYCWHILCCMAYPFISTQCRCRWASEGMTPEWYVIGIDHDTVCAGVVGIAIRHSTSCASGRAGRHNECCAGLQYQPRQRKPYKWSISILPRS